ncbi:hypothetical protein KY339_02060 [Candidatus Woesearchaeota archaeon]|nr:hypothetical protein [Candidatus Woesearchaeota archaeon]
MAWGRDPDFQEYKLCRGLLAVTERTLSSIDKAIEKACGEGDIRFALQVYRKHAKDQVIDSLFLDFKYVREELDLGNFDLQRRDIGQLVFDCSVAPMDRAFFRHEGRLYHVDSSQALSACRSVVELIEPFEKHGGVTVFGTEYFKNIGFLNKEVPGAPRVYHTDDEKSQLWKKYLLETKQKE